MLTNSLNNAILNFENQSFIDKNIDVDVAQLLLKQSLNTLVDLKLLIEKIEAKRRSKNKLPTWFYTKKIYYPNKLNVEQSSSEITAQYNSNLVSGTTLVDLTGGFGVDCFYFAKQIKQVYHCEIDKQLSQIVAHNYKQFATKNITCFAGNGLSFLASKNATFDWIYVDPSRRDDLKGKVFLLKDCLPNIPEHLDVLLKCSKNIMIKTSPLLDFTSGIKELSPVKAIHCVAVNNEVKELLWILERDYTKAIEIKTINITKENNQIFNFLLPEETHASSYLSKPLTYLYEPNAAILKAGAFEVLAEKLCLKKLHKHSHLYTASELIEFPGRCFKIEAILDYNKKRFKREFKNIKANVTTRNFPESVAQIRKKLGLKDGGNDYLFFTTDLKNNKIIVCCSKL